MLTTTSRLGHKDNHRFLKVSTERKETLSLQSALEAVVWTPMFDGGRLNVNESIAENHAATRTSTAPVWGLRHGRMHSRRSQTRGVAATCTPLDIVLFLTRDRHCVAPPTKPVENDNKNTCPPKYYGTRALVKSIPTQAVVNDSSIRSVCFFSTEAPGRHTMQRQTHARPAVAEDEASMKVRCSFLLLCFVYHKYFESTYSPLGTERHGVALVLPFIIPALVSHASLTAPPREGRSRVMVLLPEAPSGAKYIGDPDDDVPDVEDEPLNELRRFLHAMANRKTHDSLGLGGRPILRLRHRGSNRMTTTLHGNPALGTPPIVPGCPMPTSNSHFFEVPLHRLTALLTRAACSL